MMRLAEKTLRKDLAQRLHLVASALEDGTITLEAFDSFMAHVPERFTTRGLRQRYIAYRSKQNGTIAQQSETSINSDATNHHTD